MTTTFVPEGSPLAQEAPKQKLVKMPRKKDKAEKFADAVEANGKEPSTALAVVGEPKAKPKKVKSAKKKIPKAKKASTGKSLRSRPSKSSKKPTSAKGKPRGRGIRADGKPRRRPGTNKAKTPQTAAYGKRVASARKKKDWSQAELAKKVGASQPGIANIERGVAGASEDMKKRIGKALGVAA